MKATALYVAMCMLPVTTFAGDSVHRWVDERGVVNYGDRPPEGRKASRVETTDPLGVTEPVQRPAAAAPATAGAGFPDRGVVQREVEEALRRERSAAERDLTARREAAKAQARQRCEEQRRVDCDNPALPDESILVVPPRIVRRHYPIQPVYPAHPPAQTREQPMLMRKLP
ncbi:DUF4124 domain-containing protein [Methyloversatilis sp.]|uniref:DUF4124 domain-containing protein n=1 Tax=Methyloversatilis sp. TaxID=2569862 RepID=UPI0035B4B240